jgi:hypothetical protein
MARYELTAPDGGRYEVTAPDNMPEAAVLARFKQEIAATAPAPQSEMGWGDYLKGLGREAIQGATFDFGDELGITDRDASQQFSTQHPIASTVARIAGSLPLFAAGPGAWAARAAMGGKSLLSNVGRSAGLGAGLGAVSGAGAGEGGLAERGASALTGAAVGGVVGGAIPPLAAGAGAAARWFGRRGERLIATSAGKPPISEFNAYSNPIDNATFMADGAPPAAPPAGVVAPSQANAILDIRDVMIRSGFTREQIEAMIQRLEADPAALSEAMAIAIKPHSSGQAQNRQTLADIHQGLSRLLGVYARRSPEAAEEMTNFFTARQTGMLPPGGKTQDFAARGLPVRERFSESPNVGTVAAERAYGGNTFGAGSGNAIPMGRAEVFRDWLERALLVKDRKYHGFRKTGFETIEAWDDAARTASNTNYDAFRRATAMSNFRQQVDDVFSKAIANAEANHSRTVVSALQAAQRRFGEGRINGEKLDNIKRELDNLIAQLYSKPGTQQIARVMDDARDELLRAVDTATGGATGTYATARGAHAKNMRQPNAYFLGKHALEEQEAVRRSGPLSKITQGQEVSEAHYARLTTEDERQAFRTGLVDAIMSRAEKGQFHPKIFDEPRVAALLRMANPTDDAGRMARLGAFVDVEKSFPETQHMAVGNSKTAMRVQDDLMQIATEASQNVQTFSDIIKGNQSLYQLGERLFTWAWGTAFGPRAEAAREGTRMLTTANPVEQAAVLREVLARYPASRVAHFNRLMEEANRYMAASASMLGGVAGAPAPTSPSGPTML